MYLHHEPGGITGPTDAIGLVVLPHDGRYLALPLRQIELLRNLGFLKSEQSFCNLSFSSSHIIVILTDRLCFFSDILAVLEPLNPGKTILNQLSPFVYTRRCCCWNCQQRGAKFEIHGSQSWIRFISKQFHPIY